MPTKILDDRIAIIGLGYVGLPLAVEFCKHYETVGFDIDAKRIEQLSMGHDRTNETSKNDLLSANNLRFTEDVSVIDECNIFIVTVPTPVTKNKQPDLTPLIAATRMIAKRLKIDDIVIFESTVYPGATEEDLVPVLEAESGLTFNVDFFCGYSPERINPGDKKHTLTSIIKVTSGSNAPTAEKVDSIYSNIISAGTYRASSIKVAEAAKVIENTQRDVNIGLINELALIFSRLGIDTSEVLEAANTKWNFLPFQPGLVGGHCIGVDPYYLTHKALSVGYHPELILAGRRINDGMASFIVTELVKAMIQKFIHVNQSKVLIMGLTFKENCPDLRNTKVIDVINELQSYGAKVDCYDPWVNREEAMEEYGICPIENIASNSYEAIVIAVPHSEFVNDGISQIRSYAKEKSVIFDVKAAFPNGVTDIRL